MQSNFTETSRKIIRFLTPLTIVSMSWLISSSVFNWQFVPNQFQNSIASLAFGSLAIFLLLVAAVLAMGNSRSELLGSNKSLKASLGFSIALALSGQGFHLYLCEKNIEKKYQAFCAVELKELVFKEPSRTLQETIALATGMTRWKIKFLSTSATNVRFFDPNQSEWPQQPPSYPFFVKGTDFDLRPLANKDSFCQQINADSDAFGTDYRQNSKGRFALRVLGPFANDNSARFIAVVDLR